MKKLKSILMFGIMAAMSLGAASCNDSFIFDGEGDCNPKVQFIFKKHRHALESLDGRVADVFYTTVGTVHLFVYDEKTGELVFEKIEKTGNLLSRSDLGLGTETDKCIMPLEIDPGRYKIVAWCGLDESDQNNAFYLEESETRGKYNECLVKRENENGAPVHSEKYQNLYHGIRNSVEVTYDYDGHNIIPIELTKDNNDISVYIQHVNSTLDIDEYDVYYIDSNGGMSFEDNSLTRSEKLEYKNHRKSLLEGGSTDYNGDIVETNGLVAHISTSRLLESNFKEAKLEVRTKEGYTVFSIPFIDYVIQVQQATNDNQYYLDCEDTYNCNFLLTGSDGHWTPARIIINNWVVAPDQHENVGGENQ